MPYPIYMLRRNFPLWCADATVDRTLAFCRKNRVGEIIWKIDAEDFNHGFTPFELQKQYASGLCRARRRHDDSGVIFSLNPWLTLNHIARNRYPDAPPEGFHWRVKADGSVAPEMACPLAAAWRKWLLDGYGLYAGLEPARLWIEDDFKTFAHHPGELGCFCAAHLEAFGWKHPRAELVAAIASDAGLRRDWFNFCGGVMLDICRDLEETVHAISPETQLGLMCSWSVDGRWWSEALKILAGKHRPLARTSLAPYSECLRRDFLPDGGDLWKETACLAPGTVNCPELENSPYELFNKSVSTTRLQILTGFLAGNRSITLNLYDMVGTPIPADDPYGAMLKKLHPLLAGWNRLNDDSGKFRGVAMPFIPNYADRTFPAAGNTIFDGDKFAPLLQGCGIPVVPGGGDDAAVFALTGSAALVPDDDAIMRMLSRGVMLDGRAAAILRERGFGELLGCEIGRKCDASTRQLSAERDDLSAGGGGGGEPVYLTLSFITRRNCRYYELKPLPGAGCASMLVDRDHRELLPGWVYFRNRLGGRVAVCAYNLNDDILPDFMSANRRAQLRGFYLRLCRRRPELLADGDGWMMPFRRDFPGHTLLGAVNFGLDAWNKLALSFAFDGDTPPCFRRLGADGKLRRVVPDRMTRRRGIVTAHFKTLVAPGDAAIFEMTGVDSKTKKRGGETTAKLCCR